MPFGVFCTSSWHPQSPESPLICHAFRNSPIRRIDRGTIRLLGSDLRPHRRHHSRPVFGSRAGAQPQCAVRGADRRRDCRHLHGQPIATASRSGYPGRGCHRPEAAPVWHLHTALRVRARGVPWQRRRGHIPRNRRSGRRPHLLPAGLAPHGRLQHNGQHHQPRFGGEFSRGVFPTAAEDLCPAGNVVRAYSAGAVAAHAPRLACAGRQRQKQDLLDPESSADLMQRLVSAFGRRSTG